MAVGDPLGRVRRDRGLGCWDPTAEEELPRDLTGGTEQWEEATAAAEAKMTGELSY